MDQYLFQLINGLAGKSAYLDKLGVFCGEYLGYVLMAIVLVIFWKKWREVISTFLAGILARFGIVELIRLFWEKPRPFIENSVNLLVNHEDTGSFPSGHAAFYFALAAVVYSYNKKIGIWFFVAAFLISLSRIFIGVHWPSDVLAGAIVGIFSGWLVLRISKRF